MELWAYVYIRMGNYRNQCEKREMISGNEEDRRYMCSGERYGARFW